MKKIIFQLLPAIVVMIATTTGFSYNNNGCQPVVKPTECKPCKPCCDETSSIVEPTTCAYNAPARVDIACGWDVFVTGSFLYWQAREKGTDLGLNQYPDPELGNNFVHRNVINMDFDYDPAFKVGLGWSSDRDDWTFYLEYTRFHSKNTKHHILATVDANNMIQSNWWYPVSANFHANVVGQEIHAHWKLHMDLFDLEMGRPHYVGKKLIFTPHYGLRGGWIHQTYTTRSLVTYGDEYTTTATIYTHNKSDSCLIGPRAGLDTKWMLGEGFRLFGDVAAALFYQSFKTHLKQDLPVQTNVETAYQYRGHNKIGYLTPNVEFGLGLGYGTYFADDSWYFDISAGYDFHYFWNQNSIRHFNDLYSTYNDHDIGDLMLHGITITARLDF